MREKSWHNLPLPPHQLVRLAGDDEAVEKPAATEGVNIVLENRLRFGQGVHGVNLLGERLIHLGLELAVKEFC